MGKFKAGDRVALTDYSYYQHIKAGKEAIVERINPSGFLVFKDWARDCSYLPEHFELVKPIFQKYTKHEEKIVALEETLRSYAAAIADNREYTFSLSTCELCIQFQGVKTARGSACLACPWMELTGNECHKANDYVARMVEIQKWIDTYKQDLLLEPKKAALIACPFCRRTSSVHTKSIDNEMQWVVVCDASTEKELGGCGASCGYRDSEEEAIERWNKRSC